MLPVLLADYTSGEKLFNTLMERAIQHHQVRHSPVMYRGFVWQDGIYPLMRSGVQWKTPLKRVLTQGVV